MSAETHIALNCPYCNIEIYQPLIWFKQAYFTCPHCQRGLAEGQFAGEIADLEEAMDTAIDEMVRGTSCGGCCKGKGTC